jgi:hypothetical protein
MMHRHLAFCHHPGGRVSGFDRLPALLVCIASGIPTTVTLLTNLPTAIAGGPAVTVYFRVVDPNAGSNTFRISFGNLPPRMFSITGTRP